MNKPSSLLLLASLLLPAADAAVILPINSQGSLVCLVQIPGPGTEPFTDIIFPFTELDDALGPIDESGSIQLPAAGDPLAWAAATLLVSGLGGPGFDGVRVTSSATTQTAAPGGDALRAMAISNYLLRFTVDEEVFYTLSGRLTAGAELFSNAVTLGGVFIGDPTLAHTQTTGDFHFTGTLQPGTRYFLQGIIGAGARGENQFNAASLELEFKITPVPEPAALAGVAAAGLLGFAAWRRRAR